jgi:hypothetical protein
MNNFRLLFCLDIWKRENSQKFILISLVLENRSSISRENIMFNSIIKVTRNCTFLILLPPEMKPLRRTVQGVACGAGHFYAINFPKLMGIQTLGGFARIGRCHD